MYAMASATTFFLMVEEAAIERASWGKYNTV
jgi:hypothetical protein